MERRHAASECQARAIYMRLKSLTRGCGFQWWGTTRVVFSYTALRLLHQPILDLVPAIIVVVVAALIVGCSSPPRAEQPAAPALDAATVKALPPCASAIVAELDDYLKIEVPGSYWVDMVFDAKRDAWKQVRSIRMPPHHSTRLRFLNIGEYSQLDQHRDLQIRFTVDVLSRKVEQVPNEKRWWATYSAKVVELCAVARP